MVRNLLALKAGEKVARQRASLESEVKATLFSEAIHHLNNPLNQIDGGVSLYGRTSSTSPNLSTCCSPQTR